MKKTSLLVFLHGFGGYCEENSEFIDRLGQAYDAEVLRISAPFPSGRDRGGYAWFPITPGERKRILDDGAFVASQHYIITEIEKKLTEYSFNRDDVIMSGRSQGAFMAIYVGLHSGYPIKAVVSLCGYYPEVSNLDPKHNVQIVRLRGGKDEHISVHKDASYKRLVGHGLTVRYVVDEQTTHEVVAMNAIDLIITQLHNIEQLTMKDGEELRTIVDDHNEIIRYKKKKDMTKDDIYRVSVLWIKNAHGDVLLAQRSRNKKHDPGKRGPAAAGTVTKGENFDDVVVRETKEEIGLDIDIHDLHTFPCTKTVTSYTYFAQWYVLTIDKDISEFTPDIEEVEELRWWTREEVEEAFANQSAIFLESMKEKMEIFDA